MMVATVFNPPANFIGLYINGILVASNNAVTDPLSDVNDQTVTSAVPYTMRIRI